MWWGQWEGPGPSWTLSLGCSHSDVPPHVQVLCYSWLSGFRDGLALPIVLVVVSQMRQVLLKRMVVIEAAFFVMPTECGRHSIWSGNGCPEHSWASWC